MAIATAQANTNTLNESYSRRGLIQFVIGALIVGVIGTSAVLMLNTETENEATGILTHTVTSGPFFVSVTEQGALASSDNTEIKCQVRGRNTVTWVVPSGSVVKEGDELVRIDTKVIEENVSLQRTNVHEATATLAETQADLNKARISVDAYLEGEYKEQSQRLTANLEVAQANLISANKQYENARKLFRQGVITDLALEGNLLTVEQSKLDLEVSETQLYVMNKYRKAMQLEERKGRITAHESKIEADHAGLSMDSKRLERALIDLGNCVVAAPKSGLVILPTIAAWKNTPDVAEGVSVVRDQILLIMPDLNEMQVTVGVHEDIVDNIKPGQKAIIRLPDLTLESSVSEVATIARPLGAWSGDIVKYDTIIKLPSEVGLKPGMSAEVEIVLSEYEDKLTVPVSSVVEIEDKQFCWVQTSKGPEKRAVIVGESNDIFVIVQQGVQEGEEVLLNPLADVEDARQEQPSTATASASNSSTDKPDYSDTGINNVE
ncbi:MAG: efflux RND transporter periplasmic adaptor subunit [Pirellulaceae bacterium]